MGKDVKNYFQIVSGGGDICKGDFVMHKRSILARLFSVICGAVIVGCLTTGFSYTTGSEPVPIEFAVEAEAAEEIDISCDEPVGENEASPEPQLSEEDINLIALVTMGEAEGEPELGKRLVIDTILNRVDDEHFPDTVHDVIYQPNQFSVMWNGRLDRCYVMPEIVELVKEELENRTNRECVFFMAGGYSKYGKPLFQECCHYFSSYD